jgi:general secretion pathway protein M
MAITLKQLFSTWTGRWQQSAAHERAVVLVLLAMALMAALWLNLWTPQRQALLRAQQTYNQEMELRNTISQLPQASAPKPETALTSETLPGLLTRSSSEAHLSLERMDTDAAGQINLSLNGSLEKLLPWLDQLNNQGITVRTLSLSVGADQQLTVQLTVQAL